MRTHAIVSSLVALGLAGCATDHPAASPHSAPPAAEVTFVQPAADRNGGPAPMGAKEPGVTSMIAPPPPSGADAGAPQETPPPLSDGEILQVTHAANLSEIEQGALAESKAKDARVRKLAVMMVRDHNTADAKGNILAKKAGIDLTPSPVSTSLQSDAQEATNALKAKSGADFDALYVDTQVKEHKAVLDLIDQKLVPAAKNAHVKEYLEDVRPKIATHLQHAQELQQAMQKK
jgi:putative membrane protein